jgi:acetyltransferase
MSYKDLYKNEFRSGERGVRAFPGEASMPKTLDRGYPSHHESILTLWDGTELVLRPIKPTDGPLIVDLFNRMSPESLERRFLAHLHELPEGMVHHFTHLDYDTRFALVAMTREYGKDALIAVARYAHDPQEDLTDIAVAVRDDWQRLGLGKALLAGIVAIAKGHGITRFKSMMDPSNRFIGQVLSDLGYQVKYSLRSGFYEVEIFV